ncbi:hypothetical protein [Pelagerythrobacter marinus]|jgi:hypothetical protein|uniref:hypothetical protein n=1 Tax=Pelagerythrobacter marinus TaxID=538382 RepID=UPI002036F94B|nr:hypothetical protein [Pelagerythrobacter marinus]USA39725.1 hypothetical protein NCF86_00770 [Pelagerythrobacter marinus]WPZ06144.1 hypothetical protein T8T98_12050 [Pelagerythrobacter marinus]
MTSDAARLRRARLIERMRCAEQRQAAAEAHRAEAVRQKLEQLSDRTRTLAQVYALRDGARDGADLRSASVLGSHLNELGATAARQAADARRTADDRLAQLAVADRRLQRAEEGRRDLARAIGEKAARDDVPRARKTGTHLE